MSRPREGLATLQAVQRIPQALLPSCLNQLRPVSLLAVGQMGALVAVVKRQAALVRPWVP